MPRSTSTCPERVVDAEREYNEALDRDWEPQEVVDSYYDQWIRAQEDLRIAEAEYNAALGKTSPLPMIAV